jgi:hypothetical protein
MTPLCPYCRNEAFFPTNYPKVIRSGSFYRSSDSKRIQRFRCMNCKKGFSQATDHCCFRQKKRHKNEILRRLLCSGVSQRRASRILNLNRKTIVRKLLFLAKRARLKLDIQNALKRPCTTIEFDDLETFEHTKCKPLSVTLAVEYPTRRILGFKVSKMPAKGHLAKLSLKKYGPRKDERARGRRELFCELKPLIEETCLIKSDSNPHYVGDVVEHFPKCTHQVFLGARGAVTGQGELKKIRFDPLFSLNHTCAKLRADINRLFRKTWCTTKKPERLTDHLAVYALYHNEHLSA